MSYDIFLVDKDTGKTLYNTTKHNISGTTYAMNGTDELWVNYSYNYREHFQHCFGPDGIHFLQDKVSRSTWSRLMQAMEYLSQYYDITKNSSNPWKPYPADAYDAIMNILNLGFMAPDGIWKIT